MVKNSLVGLSTGFVAIWFLVTPVSAQNVKPAERASKQMQAKQFDLALTSLTDALTDDEKNPMLYYRRAQCFYCLGRYKDAVEDFDHAIKFETSVPDFFLWRGTAEAKLGDDEAAVRDYERALRLKPELVLAYVEAHPKKKDDAPKSDDAKTKSDQATKSDESKAQTRDSGETAGSGAPAESSKAAAGTSTGLASTATATASGSTTLGPTGSTTVGAACSRPETASNSAELSTNKGSVVTNPSDPHTVGAADSHTVSPTGSTTVGAACSRPNSDSPVTTTQPSSKAKTSTIDLGYSTGAVKDYEEAIKRVSVKSAAYFRAGTVYSGLCEIDFNGKMLGTLMDASADGTIVKRNAADYFSLKDPNKDLREADDQITENPSAAKAYYERGRGYEQLGNTTLAFADFNRAIDLDGKNARYFLARAFLLHKLDEKQMAELDVRHALDVEPSLPHYIAFEPPKFVQTDKEIPQK
ncbi:MAG TPA: tetratricopeptide repeat protein [Planktothrix sp.]|jgi:tetratricopeptide (TPR) repeat protein